MDLAHHRVEILTQLVDILAVESRNEDTRRIGRGHIGSFQIVEREVLARSGRQIVLLFLNIGIGVDLVEDDECRLVARANLAQGLLHYVHLLLETGV